MKRLILLLSLVIAAVGVYAQNTIKFLGIPIDGSKKEMIAKLKAKGYEYDSTYYWLVGEFNGEDVRISVQTVNNRVWRLVVMDRNNRDEGDIKIRFNNLLYQFARNGKYWKSVFTEELSEKDDISYEMTVNNKRYEAMFYLSDKSINGQVWYMIGESYGRYHILLFYENLDNAANGDDL